MKVKKLYLDMDGVIANFDKRYHELFNESPADSRENKNFSPNWTTFVEGKNFATLEMFPGAEELLQFVRQIEVDENIEIEILSSSGGQKYHDMVVAQKNLWLIANGVPYKRNIVPGRRLKKDYATPETILIDDTPDVIEDFNRAGGIGILHLDVNTTIQKLKDAFGIH
ncbi:MAG: hypothetical protein EBR30_03400 [Cytophagia bacterium]|nr:hypothetical protein [Cytophagia bacterium]NBW34058.1 hypothetical protein [Cytophagia bacterium]